MWAGAILAACALPAATASTPYAALAWISMALFGIQVKSSSLFTVPADIFPPGAVALAWGLSGAAGSLGGMLFQLYVGRIVDTVGYNPVFLAVSAMHLVSVCFVMLLIPNIGVPEQA
jgi:ACS family hexuronate transporter-like MFS transporter